MAFRLKEIPRSVLGFAVAYLVCTAAGLINGLLQFEFLQMQIDEAIQQPYPVRDWVVYALIVFRIFVAIAILSWVLKSQSVIGRILIIAQMLGWLYGLPIAARNLLNGHWNSLPFVLGAVTSVATVVFMNVRKSRQWFARKGRTVADDLEVFR